VTIERYHHIVQSKVWSAEELERMTPAEQDAVFESSIVTDLDQLPPELVARVRARFEVRLAKRDVRKAP
jgi:hypothetical protein